MCATRPVAFATGSVYFSVGGYDVPSELSEPSGTPRCFWRILGSLLMQLRWDSHPGVAQFGSSRCEKVILGHPWVANAWKYLRNHDYLRNQVAVMFIGISRLAEILYSSKDHFLSSFQQSCCSCQHWQYIVNSLALVGSIQWKASQLYQKYHILTKFKAQWWIPYPMFDCIENMEVSTFLFTNSVLS